MTKNIIFKKIYISKQIFISIITIAILIVMIRVPLIDMPFERDEGEYAYIAWRIEFNELPYRDWFDQKPPAIFWLYRIALSLPFEPVRSVHLLGLFFSYFSSIALYFLARRFMSNTYSIISASTFAVLSSDPFIQGAAANTEIFMLFPIILSHLIFWIVLRESKYGKILTVIIGVLIGIAIAFKQVAIFNWFHLIATYYLLVAGNKHWRRTFNFTMLSAIGTITVWGCIFFYFYQNHAIRELIYNVFTHNIDYIRGMPVPYRMYFFIETISCISKTQAFIWIFSISGVIALLLFKNRKMFIYLMGWLFASMLGVSTSGYYFPHYFQQVLPPLSLLTALGVEVLSKIEFRIGLHPLVQKTILLVILIILPLYRYYPFIFTYSPAEAVKIVYPGNTFDKMPSLGQRIAELTKPDDRIFIFGAEPELFFYARRISASRHIFLFPLYGYYSDALEKQIEAASEISESRPAVAVVIPNGLFFLPDTEQYFTNWTNEFLATNYKIIHDEYNDVLFIRKDLETPLSILHQ